MKKLHNIIKGFADKLDRFTSKLVSFADRKAVKEVEKDVKTVAGTLKEYTEALDKQKVYTDEISKLEEDRNAVLNNASNFVNSNIKV